MVIGVVVPFNVEYIDRRDGALHVVLEGATSFLGLPMSLGHASWIPNSSLFKIEVSLLLEEGAENVVA